MTLIFRPATPNDIAECITIRGKTRENAVSAARLAELGITEASWSAQVESNLLPGHICEFNGTMAGYCFGETTTGEIVVLALLPEYENLSIGKKLLHLMMSQLHACGHQRLFLGCAADPAVRSHGFYRHLGWQPTGTIDTHGDEVLEYICTAPFIK
jgi:ribosomal protein S18 acetylase RimI-like enzyme